MSAQDRMLALLLKNVGEFVSLAKLSSVAQTSDFTRSLRTLRQIGWEIETVKNGYILHSSEKKETGKNRGSINAKMSYAVFHRDNSICQRCGKTPAEGAKLQADHKIPVEMGGLTDLDNLWTLCSECNGGKKNLFSDFDANIMTQVLKEKSGYGKMMKYFELNPNTVIEPYVFDIISGIRDWERTLRLIRKKEHMDIVWIKNSEEFPKGGYINNTKKKK